MAYAPDPGSKFASDAHRRVLGHLSTPEDEYGWTSDALYARLKTDLHAEFTQDDLNDVLAELKADGHASDNNVGVWRQTEDGFKSITEEPPVDESQPVRPATIGAATPLGEPIAEASGTPQEAASAIPTEEPTDG